MSIPHIEYDSEDSRTITEDHSENVETAYAIPSAFHVSSAFTTQTSANVISVPQRRWNPVINQPRDEDSPCEIYLVSQHMPEVRHERLPTEETLKKRKIDNEHKLNSLIKCRYTILFLANKINRYQSDIKINIALLKRQKSKKGLPLPFNMTIQISERYQQQLVKLVKLSNSMNTPEGMSYLSTNGADQSRKKFMFWRNVLYEISSIIGFKLVIDSHTGRNEKITALPKELANGKKLLTCQIGDYIYKEREIIDEGKAIYTNEKLFFGN